MSGFVHLHVHSEYSLLDGAGRITRLLDKCRELGMASVAITDHGVMYGVVDFYKEAKARGIHPVIGCEVYVAPRRMGDKVAHTDKDYAHLVLLAKNQTGYNNLMILSSLGFTEGYYYKPRIDYDTLHKYAEGLICLSACLSGDIPRYIINGRVDEAVALALRLKDMFGKEDFYLELQDHGIEGQRKVNQELIRIGQAHDIPLVATNDIHYINREDAYAQDVLICIQTGKTVEDSDRMQFDTREFYVKSPEEMAHIFPEVPQALQNTVDIANRCQVDFDFSTLHLPEFTVPVGTHPATYLRALCMQGLQDKYEDVTQEVLERIHYELSTIEQMDYVDYFLIVWDFIKYARDNGIMVGPGRGSAAGSLVAYALDITQIDPLKYGLLFERFLNPERISMPDIDIDFCYERRQEVIDYVIRKYGADRVAQIITFGTMAARAAIRDVGRALNLPYGDVDRIAKMIPFDLGMTIEKALEMNAELKMLSEEDPSAKNLIETARNLEGLPRHASTHAAGVVISKRPITEHVPLQKNDECLTTQFSMGILEQLGLLKMDFLGLRTLTVIRDSLQMIKDNHGLKIDIQRIPMDDAKVYDMLGQADTEGVFQLESAGMKQFMKELKPTTFEDIIAGISLYRPGPMDQIPRYIANKNRPEAIEYTDILLAPVLKVTYGCMVYQEQVMQIVQDLAGYSLGRADLVRRAMSKKKTEVMQQERHHFIYGMTDEAGAIVVQGALRRGLTVDKANQIFDEMMEFAKYAFNKSHAAAYALIAYQTAWLKVYYPVEFMAALMTSIMGNAGKVAAYIQYARKKGIQVLPPDVNESQARFTVVENKIRFGLAAVKNVGLPAIDAIIEARRGKGSFVSFTDFCHKVEGNGANKRLVESLIKCGAFDSVGAFRSQLLSVHEKVLDGVTQDRRRNVTGQVSLFELSTSPDHARVQSDVLPDMKEYPQKLLLSMEKEMVGLYISGHPLEEFKDALEQYTSTLDLLNLNQPEEEGLAVVHSPLSDGSEVTIAGIVVDKKTKYTKNNHLMAFITLEDLFGTVEVIVFPTVYSRYGSFLEPDQTVVVNGRISLREEEEPKIICNEVKPLSLEIAKKPNMVRGKKLYLKISTEHNPDIEDRICSILEKYRGNIPVVLYLEATKTRKMAHKQYWIEGQDALFNELYGMLGKQCVKMVD